ncbi:hypothetical protein H6F90_18465 [Trichocoleus sp. FACHB-591]|uniref:hypothetical protein n=1 Tax=Trichocoleus sp. FACHB-591 TaxID=2692872 RepID=UPI0016830048|nr:hypothetical protein [Trichocoleus sp. FACHB-591]MBD2097087.1 hypothetical protein [Trichocoleus sp. FACHB-591]
MQNKQVRLASMLSAGILMLGVPAVTLMQEPASAQLAGQATVGNLIAALNNIAVQITNLEALNGLTVQDVRVVNVEDVLNDNNVQAFNNALNRNEVEILTLQNTLNNNEIIKNVLNNNNVEIGQVVAVDVLSGGDVILFYQ